MHKKDEMEQTVANKAFKVSWSVTIIALILIGNIQYFMDDKEMNLFLLIGMLSVTVFFLVEQYYLTQIKESNTFKKVLAGVLLLILILLGITWLAGL